MAEKKYARNFMFNQSPDNSGHPFGSFDFTQMFDMNSLNMEKCNNWIFCAWFRGPLPDWQIYKPHVHDDDEIIGYFGSNPKDPFDLGGEIEIWIEGEPYNFIKSCLLFLPRGVMHCPWFIKKVESPIFIMFIHSTAEIKGGYFVDDPKWSHLPMLPKGSDPTGVSPSIPAPPLLTLEEHRKRQNR
jgi:hypothetical protein